MRRWLAPAAAYVAITTALTFPLLAQFTSTVAHDLGDPLLNTWLLWWSTQRLPLTAAWWNAPMFYPMSGAMALSEILIGLLPITGVVQFLSNSPLQAYNAAFVLSFPLSALAAYALTLELTDRREAAFLAGIAYAFAPYRMGQLAHVQMLSYYWAPIALLGLHRYVRTKRRADLAIFALAWLLQALSNGYALFHLSILVALWIVWFARPLRSAVPIVGAWALAAVPLVPILLKYREIHAALHLVRDINEIKRFGVDIADVVAAPMDLTIWGSRLMPARPETAIFPGVTVLAVGVIWAAWTWRQKSQPRPARTLDERLLTLGAALAALVALSTVAFGTWRLGPLSVGNFHKPFSIAVGLRLLAFFRSPRIRVAWSERSVVAFYALAMLAMYVLALGPEPRLLGRPLLYEPPYAWLMRMPGFDVLRVPARFAMLGVLCQTAILAFAVARNRIATLKSPIVVAGLALGLLADGWVHVRAEPAPPTGPDWKNVASVVELPPGGDADFGAIFRSMSHGRPIVNGYSGYNPPHYLPLVFAIRDHQYAGLYDVAAGRPMGIAVNRQSPDASEIEASLARMYAVGRGPDRGDWATFTLYRRLDPPVRLGPRVPIANVHASPHDEDVGRLVDQDIGTAWGSGTNQIGDEEIAVDLGSTKDIGAVVLAMGAYSFGYPRAFEIRVSVDGVDWMPVWGGEPASLVVHAAVADPSVVPVTFDLARVSARYVQLRQVGNEPGIPWWVAELSVYAPAAPSP